MLAEVVLVGPGGDQLPALSIAKNRTRVMPSPETTTELPGAGAAPGGARAWEHGAETDGGRKKREGKQPRPAPAGGQ